MVDRAEGVTSMKQYLMVFLLSWSCLLSAAELPDWLQQVAAEKRRQPEAMLALLQQQRAQKRDKLLQYGRRIWQLQHQDEERLIDDAIAHTRAFFEQMGVPTRLADYGINADAVDKLVAALTANGMLKLGEHGDITPEVSRQILQRAV